KRLDVRGLDGRAAPDAQARRRVAIAADVEGDLFFLEPSGDVLRDRGLTLGVEAGEPRIGELQADRGARTSLRPLGQEIDPGGPLDPGGDGPEIGFGAPDKALEPADALGPFH